MGRHEQKAQFYSLKYMFEKLGVVGVGLFSIKRLDLKQLYSQYSHFYFDHFLTVAPIFNFAKTKPETALQLGRRNTY